MNHWPVPNSISKKIPLCGQGSFSEERGDRLHCGVDLYAPSGSDVVSIEDGIVIQKGVFTSPKKVSYWFTTYYVVIRQKDGTLNRYCEMKDAVVEVGEKVKAGQTIGHVGCVLNFKKISHKSPRYIQKIKEGGIPSMLHFERWSSEPTSSDNYLGGNWFGDELPKNLLNPTKYLTLNYYR